MSTGPEREDDLDVLPETTSDERGEGWGEAGRDALDRDADSNDARLEEDRPPHW